jgi:hypothetical protein
MSTLTLRNVKGSPLTNTEVDNNFSNLNTDKYQAGDSPDFVDTLTDKLSLDLAAAAVVTTGEFAWNLDEGTADLGLNGGDTLLHVGQELHYRVINQTGTTIPIGALVMYDGSIGASGKIKVKPWVGGADPLLIVGITTAAIPTEGGTETGLGYVTAFGKVRKVNTSGTPYSETWADGDILYAGPTGGLTKTRPTAPNTKSIIAAVIRAHPTVGTLLVRVTLSSSLENDDEVELTSPADKDLLQWNNTAGRFENKSLVNAGVQPTLVSGTNIKTVNNTSLLGTGNVAVGTVTSVATNNGVTGGTITTTGTIGLTGQALALHNLASNGVIARTGTDTVAARTITASTGISVTNGDGVSGNPTITNTGVTSVAGTTNQVATSGATGSITLSLPQNIHTGATPTFGGMTLSGALAMGSNKVTGLAAPTDATDATTKQYVDEVAEGLKAKPAVELATTANLTSTYNNGVSGVGATLTATSNGAFPTIDGVTLATTTPGQNGVLVKNQTNKAQNGRYNLTTVGNGSTPWVLTRCGLCDEADEIPGAYIFVKAGTLYAGTGWVQVVADPSTFIVGTDNIDVIQFSGAGTYTAGTGLTLTGTQFSVDASQTQVTAVGTLTGGTWNANTIAPNYGGTGQTTYTNGQLLIGNSTGNTLSKATLTAGTGISVTNGAGSISIAATNNGTVTSVGLAAPTGFTVTNSPVTGSGTLTLNYDTGYALPTTAKQTEWDTAYTERRQWDGGSTNLNASTGRTSLGATTLGSNIFTIPNPAAITFPRFNADNTVSALSDADFRTAIGAGTGTVTSIATNNGITGGTITSTGTVGLTGQALALHNLATNGVIARTGTGTVAARTITASTGISITNGDGVSGNPTITNTAPDQTVVLTAGTGITTSGTYPNFTIANGGVTSFTAGTTGLTPNSVTTGAITLGGTLNVANGGTGQTSYTDGQLLIGNTTGNTLTKATLTPGTGISITNGSGSISIAATNNGTVTSVGGTGTVNGITLSGTVTSTGNLTLGGTLSGVDLTSQVTGTLPVANGGTGAATLTANNVLLGNGTSAVQTVAPGTVGNVLVSDGTTWISGPGGGGATIADDTSTNATRYLTFTSATSGGVSTLNVSSTKLTFNPSNGNLVVAGDVTSNSDIRLKSNIEQITGALGKVASLRGVTFDMENARRVGVIAQEVQKVVPEVVSTTEQGYLAVSYGNLTALLIEAVKELSTEVSELKARLGEK